MMNNNSWGMGWGMWVIPLALIVIIVFMVRSKRRR